MRLLLSIILAASGGYLLMAVLTSEDDGATADLRRGRGGDDPLVVKPPDEDPVRLQGAHGTDVYAPRSGSVILQGEGEPTTYGALLLWCRRFDAETEERFRVQDVRIIVHDKPKTRADLERHYVVPRDTRPAQVGDLLLDQLKSKKVAGVHAKAGVFEGGRDLKTARNVMLEGGVTVYVVDPDDPERTGEIRTASLRLELEEGQVLRGVTDDPATVVTADGTLAGEGLSFDPGSGVFRIERNITGRLEDVMLLGRRGPPASFTAGGPLIYEPEEQGEKRSGVALTSSGAIRLSKDVIVTQGEYELRGQEMLLETRSGRSSAEGFTIEREVAAKTPEGSFSGDRITWIRKGEDTTLTIDGAPVTATLTDAARALPGVGAKGDLKLSTDGTIVFAGLDRPDQEERTITIGPEVVLTGDNGARITSTTVNLSLLHVARNSAEVDAEATKLYPVVIKLDGAVAGSGPSGSFKCKTLEYERSYQSGRAVLDRILLTGTPELTYLTTDASATKSGDSSPESEPKIGELLTGKGPLRIAADQSLELRLDPMRVGPTRAAARAGVRVRRFDALDADKERGRLHAEEVDLVLTEDFSPNLQSASIRFAGKRRVRSVTARKDVYVLVPDRLEGTGQALTWNGDAGDLELLRSENGTPAVVTVTDRRKNKQSLEAPMIVYRREERALEASGGVTGRVMIPPISYGRGRVGEPTETTVKADAITAWMKGEDAPVNAPGSTPRSGNISELHAAGSVEISQGAGTGVGCDNLRVNLLREETIIRGAPARIDILHVEGDAQHPEWVEAPVVIVADGTALLTGKVKARLHARKKDVAMNVGSREKETSQALRPIDIEADQDLFISDERVLARGGDGRTTIKQGNPEADGFLLASDRVLLVLGRENPAQVPTGASRSASSKLEGLDVEHAVISGDVSFTSPDIRAEGDVIEFSNRDKVVILYRYGDNTENRDARLTWRGEYQLPRPRFDLELSDPENPQVVSTLAPPRRESR